MAILADTHVHIYPCYDFQVFLESAFQNLERLGHLSGLDRVQYALFLAERLDCCFFREFCLNSASLLPGGYTCSFLEDFSAVLLTRQDTGMEMLIFPGRQIVSRERIEVLALLSGDSFEEGLPLKETIRQILDKEAVPVLCWAPGKWVFERGRMVIELIEELPKETIFLGDTSLRSPIFAKPALFDKGLLLAGSDPLPFKGEEMMAGSYASLINLDLEKNKPLSYLRGMLKSGSCGIETVGSRSGVISGMHRLCMNEVTRRFGRK